MTSRSSTLVLHALALLLCMESAASLLSQQSLPNSPVPQTKTTTEKPCFNPLFQNNQAHQHAQLSGVNSVLASSYPLNELPKPCGALEPVLASVTAPVDRFARFLTGPQVKTLTPADKAHLALRNLFDPFNALTILGQSGISVASDSHSPYGPGFPGFGKNVGVSFTQDMTDQFFNTFLVSSIMHQDPHYHRRPDLTIKRRIVHTVIQVLWTKGDDGRNIPNYSNIIGNAIDDEISNLYVPGRQTNLPASAQRYAFSLASAPIDNLITEFLPDIASHIHVKDVLIQRIINQVAKQ